MAVVATHNVGKGMCKKTAKALRWLGFLSCSLIVLVVLAQSRQAAGVSPVGYSAMDSAGQMQMNHSAPMSLR